MSVFTGSPQSAIDETLADARAYGLPADLLLAVAVQEGHLSDPLAVQTDPGNRARDYGIFNINVPAGGQREQELAGLSLLQLSDPDLAFRIQGPQWRQAFDQFGGLEAWQADPVGFFQSFMPVAQGSVAVPAGSAPYDVQEGKALAGGDPNATLHFSSPAASGVGIPAATPTDWYNPGSWSVPNPAADISKSFAGWVASWAARVGVFIVGGLIIAGGFLLLAGSHKTVVETVGKAAAA